MIHILDLKVHTIRGFDSLLGKFWRVLVLNQVEYPSSVHKSQRLPSVLAFDTVVVCFSAS